MEFEQDHHVALVLDEALGLLDHHLRHLHVARGRLIEGRGDHLALDRALHVGDLFGPLVDQQHDQVALGVVLRDRVGDVLQQHRLAGARLRHDQRALALAERRHDVDHPRREVLDGGVLDLEVHPLGRIQRGEVVEVHLVALLVGVLEIDQVDLEQREVALSVLGAADLPLDGVAGPQRKAPDLRRGDIDVVGPRQVVGVGRAQEAEAVLQHLDHAGAGDVDLLGRKLLEDREHQLLLAHGAGVLDADLFGEAQQLRRGFDLEVL